MGFTSEITDDFNRGDGDSLGANWSEFVGDIDIVSNTAKHISSTGYWAGARYSGAQTSTADEYVQFYSQTYQNDMGVVARWQDSTTFYATRFRGNDVLFMRGDGATDPTLLLDSVNTATGASSHTYKMSVTGTGATVTLKSYYDGIETFSYDDTNALRITTKGYTGIFGYGVNAKYDDFEAGKWETDVTTTSTSSSTSSSTTSTSSSTPSSTSTSTTINPSTGGLAFGEQSPTGESAVSWATFIRTGSTISGSADWGKLETSSGNTGNSKIYDFGTVASRLITLTDNKYGTGSGTGTKKIRGQDTVFVNGDGTPSWETYSGPISKTWRFIQVQITK